MNQLPTLADFFETIADDARIGPAHVVVYIALMHLCAVSGGHDTFEVATYEMLRLTKILKKDTYLLRIKQLAAFGYLKYIPAENEHIKAMVAFKKL
jgi:hypothetical protein